MSLLKKLISSFKKVFAEKPRRSVSKRSSPKIPRKTKKPKTSKKKKPTKVAKAVKVVKAAKPVKPVQPTKQELKKQAALQRIAEEKALGEYVGPITHYFNKIQVIVLNVEKSRIALGDKIRIKGKVSDFVQTVKSLQIESVNVKSAAKGKVVGLKVDKEAHPGDKVYKQK